MRACREMNMKISQDVFGYGISMKKKVWTETTPQGDRPLRNYCKEIQWAWEVAEKMKITLIPVVGDQWFAFSGPSEIKGWDSPQAVLKFLEAGNFAGCGAAVDKDPALAICTAALNAVEKRKGAETESKTENTDTIPSRHGSEESNDNANAARNSPSEIH